MLNKSISKYTYCCVLSVFLAALFFSSTAFAADGFDVLADNVSGTLKSVLGMLQGVALVAGLGFSIAAIFKFKQHKDNPTQIPIGTPIALVFIGAALIFLPSLIGTTAVSVFGDSANQSGIGDDAITNFTGG